MFDVVDNIAADILQFLNSFAIKCRGTPVPYVMIT